ncbi:MAG TPA: TonB-dependent receptor plug domain-containing protein, partial [Bacteroidota bacterium]|nr:TonB-dependent receptor plug domain-containing protein [Bacteroidota bacterium]
MPRMRFVFLISIAVPVLVSAGDPGTKIQDPAAGLVISSDSAAFDSVEIAAPRPLISKGASNVIHIVDRDFFTNLPARGIDAAILLQPGVMPFAANRFGGPLISIRGGREGDVGYRIEDVPANDLIWSGRSVTVTAEAIEQIQVHAGGPAAEFGGGSPGLVSIQLRTGRSDGWGGSLMAETDRYAGMGSKSLGGYSYGYSDWTATAGGPLPVFANALRLFASVQNTFYRDPSVSVRSGYDFSGANAVATLPVITPYHSSARPDTLNLVFPDGVAPGGSDNRWIMTGTALLEIAPVKIRMAGSYSYDRSQTPAGLGNLLNQSRLPLNIAKDGFLNVRVSHDVSPWFTYEAGFGYAAKTYVTEDPQLLDNIFAYGDPAANAALGYSLFRYPNGLTGNWGAYYLWDGSLSLNQPGTQIAGYQKTSQESFSGRAAITLRAGMHELKAGGEYTQYTTREFAPSGVFSLWSERLVYPSPALLDLMLARNSGGTGYGYDLYGREINSDDVRGGELYSLGPRKPLFWS